MSKKKSERKIHRLDRKTIDQIAAGEVIDAPYSCVKELVDNAIDAGAKEILIETSIGGRDLIRVKDNGFGMSHEDILLSVERHATSKLRSIEDLDRIASLGFRGEALSSIGSISELTILSTPREGDSEASIGRGAEIVIHGGEQISYKTDILAEYGTMVEIRSLFYNVPARRKFMKSPSKDSGDIYKSIQNIALSHPEVSFRYISDKNVKCDYPHIENEAPLQQFYRRIRAIIGEEVASRGHFFESSFDGGMKIRGFLASPLEARSTRSGQHLIVNGRPVFSSSLAYSIKLGYSTAISREAYPMFIVSLDIDPEEIDVNVHPQKKEIRFRNEEYVRASLEQEVSKQLFSLSSHEGFQKEEIEEKSYTPPNPLMNRDIWSISEEKVSSFSSPQVSTYSRELPLLRPSTLFEQESSRDEILSTREEKSRDDSFSVRLLPDGDQTSDFHALLVCFNTDVYVMHLENSLHALLILRELDTIRNTESAVSEPLLIPHLLRVVKHQAEIIERALPELRKLGFVLRSFGQESFMIEAVPQGALLGRVDFDSYFQAIIQEKMRDEEDIDESSHSVTKEQKELQQASSSARRIMKSMKIFSSPGLMSVDFFNYIVQEWVLRGKPKVSLSGEEIAIQLETSFCTRFFGRKK